MHKSLRRAFLLTLSLALWSVPGRAHDSHPASSAADDSELVALHLEPSQHRKATAPVHLELDLEGTSGAEVLVRFRARPGRAVLSLEAELTLPHGGSILDQQRIVRGALAQDELAEGWARVRLPEGAAQLEISAELVVATPEGDLVLRATELRGVGEGLLPTTTLPVLSGGEMTRDSAAERTGGGALPMTAGATVSGIFEYIDRQATLNGGWDSTSFRRPIRLASVVVLDAATDTVLATGVTGLDGTFDLPLPGSGTADLVVRCLSYTDAFGPGPFEITDAGQQRYSVSSSVVAGWDLGTGLDVGKVVAQKVLSGNKQGGPFSQLDCLVDAGLYLQSLGAAPAPNGIQAFWPGGTQSYATGHMIYLSTDDGFDDMVMLHEIGHVVGTLYSDTDHSGGSHSFGESDQWPSLSMGEGYASFFGGAVRRHAGYKEPGQYIDCNGGATTGPASLQLRLDFESGFPWASVTGGEADEVAVACSLWNLIDTAATDDGDTVDDDPVDGSFLFPGGLTGDELLWAAYTGATVLAAEDLTIYQVFGGLFVDGGAVEYAAIEACFDAWGIRFHEDSAEPDDSPSQAAALSLGAWSSIRTLYRPTTSAPYPADGDQDHATFWVDAQQLLEVETRYPNGLIDAETYCDPLVEVYNPSGTLLTVAENGGVGRNALLEVATVESGLHRLVVRTQSPVRKTGSYQVRAQVLGPVQAPVLTYLSPTSADVVSAAGLTGVILKGVGLSAVTDVTIGGDPVANFWASSDNDLSFVLPVPNQLGTVDIEVSGPTGSAKIPIQIMAVSQPTLLAGNGLPGWPHDTVELRMAAQPGEVMFVAVGFEEGPTSFPGVVDLAIGNGFVALLGSVQLNAAGGAAAEVPITGLPFGFEVWVQGAVLGVVPSFPLQTTNVAPGKIY